MPSPYPLPWRRLSTLVVALLAATVVAASGPDPGGRDSPAATPVSEGCVPVAGWVIPGAEAGRANDTVGSAAASTAALVARAAFTGFVLLGETHDSAEHHRWQLQVLAAIHAQHPDLVIALEMFPRRVQPALDRWVAGEIDESEFLRTSEWRDVWRFDPALYMPIFHFARMNRIPLVAINVDRTLIQSVAARGLAAVPVAEREGVDQPAPAVAAYEQMLFDSWQAHRPLDPATGVVGSVPAHPPIAESMAEPESTTRDDPDFRRFVESQLVWDREMAQGLAEAARRNPGAIVVGLMGSGHVMHGWGVSHQMQRMGMAAPLALLPWDRDEDCTELVAGYADAVFGVAGPTRTAPAAHARPRLGILLGAADGGVRIAGVTAGSIAEKSGLRKGDLITTIAGRPALQTTDVAAAVARQAPGTWLPIEVRRGTLTLDIVAKFPPAGEP